MPILSHAGKFIVYELRFLYPVLHSIIQMFAMETYRNVELPCVFAAIWHKHLPFAALQLFLAILDSTMNGKHLKRFAPAYQLQNHS